MRGVCLLLLLSLASLALAQERVLRHVPPESAGDRRSEYFIEMLRLALTPSGNGPRYRLQSIDAAMPKVRALHWLEAGEVIDVAWSMSTPEREARLRPVRIPLLKGLSGYRLLLVREAELARFETLASREELARLLAGQGRDWPDARILEANGLPVVTSPEYESLFRMLAEGRFDYFPRSVQEIHGELRAHPDSGFAIEPRLLLHYPTAIYFFVHRDEEALARDLEAGLRRAIASGQFEALFREQLSGSDPELLRDLGQRRRIELDNPLLPAATPLHERALWFELPAQAPPVRRLSPQAREADGASRCAAAREQYRLATGMLQQGNPGLLQAQRRQMQEACAGEPTP